MVARRGGGCGETWVGAADVVVRRHTKDVVNQRHATDRLRTRRRGRHTEGRVGRLWRGAGEYLRRAPPAPPLSPPLPLFLDVTTVGEEFLFSATVAKLLKEVNLLLLLDDNVTILSLFSLTITPPPCCC